MALSGIIFICVFSFAPLFGILLAFKDGDYKFNILNVLRSSDWVGLKNFGKVISDPKLYQIVLNTLSVNLLFIAIAFPISILFALLLNEIGNAKTKVTALNMASFPHFISWTVYGGIVLALTNVNTGVVASILNQIFGATINLAKPEHFRLVMLVSTILKGTGWGSIIYVAAIAGIDKRVFEAATIDGANVFQTIRRITIPCIMPTISFFLILNISKLLMTDFEQFYILQNSVNISTSEVLSTYIYKEGIAHRRYSFVTAFNFIVNDLSLSLMLICNALKKRVWGKGLFE